MTTYHESPLVAWDGPLGPGVRPSLVDAYPGIAWGSVAEYEGTACVRVTDAPAELLADSRFPRMFTGPLLEVISAERDALRVTVTEAEAEVGRLGQVVTGQAEQIAAAESARVAAVAELAALKPPTGSVLTPVEFTRRIAGAYLTIPMIQDERVRERWWRIVREMLPQFAAFYLDDPFLVQMLAVAVADGVFTQEQADAITAFSPA